MHTEPRLLGYRSSPFTGQERKLKSPIVLLRGLSRSSGFWLDFPDHLATHGDVHMIDLLGTGRSPDRRGRASMRDFAADVMFTMEREGMLPCHLVGISLGGMVSLQVAGRPDAVGKLSSLAVLASSSGGMGVQRIKLPALARMLRSIRHGRPQHEAFARDLVTEDTLQAQPDLAARWDALWDAEGFEIRAVMRQLWAAARFKAGPILERLAVPTLFMASADDQLVPWANTLKMWQRAKNADLKMLRGLGHDFPTDDPRAAAAELVSFWRKVEDGKFQPKRVG